MGEAAALRRMDLDLNTGTVSVRQQHVELDTALIFTRARGGMLRRSDFRRAAKWDENARKNQAADRKAP
jgi:hypothetical protein